MRDNPSNSPEKKVEYTIRLKSLSDEDLFKETKDVTNNLLTNLISEEYFFKKLETANFIT